ncbi:MAG: hypothetical protein NC177_13870 [Ruminococcus flavefaciens]|nr:hypothetical protein [Ruminococcus flavefaciens]
MKTDKKRSFKGAVLFTVVSVMSLLIVFLTSTLVLATAANNRAHKSYSSSQANYTAKAAIEGIRKAAESNTEFAEAIASVGATKTSLDVNVSMETDVVGIGTVQSASVNYVGQKQFYDESKKEWVNKDLISVSVDVLYGGETKTSTVYLLKDPPKKAVNNGGGGGLVTVGSASSGNHTNSFGGTYLGIGIGRGTRMYQGDYSADSGMEELQNVTLDEKRYLSNQEFFWGNEATVEAPIVINGNLGINTATEIVFPTKGSGMSVWGNLTFDNSSFKVYSATADSLNKKVESFKDIPYIFVDSCLTMNNQTIGDGSFPLNIFVGNIDARINPVSFYGNIYCQDKDKTSYLGNDSGVSTLYAWSDSVVNGTEYLKNTATSGNFYTKGNLEINGIKHGITIAGDLVVEGDLTINGPLTVGGSIAVGGTLKINNGVAVNVGTGHNIYAEYVDSGEESFDGAMKMQSDGVTPLFTEEIREETAVLVGQFKCIKPDGGTQDYQGAWVKQEFLTKYPCTYNEPYEENGKTKGDWYDANWYDKVDASLIIADANGKKEQPKEDRGDVPTYTTTVWINNETGEVTTNKADVFESDGYVYNGHKVSKPDLYMKMHNNELFPRQAEKAVILGLETLDGAVPTDDAQVEETKIVKTIDEIEEEYNFDAKSIHEVRSGADKVESNVYEEKFMQHNDPSNPERRDLRVLDNIKTEDVTESDIRVGKDANEPFVITESCTLTGNFTKDIVIRNSGEIWIKLKDFNLTNKKIIFDDLKAEEDMTPEEKPYLNTTDPDEFVYSGGTLNILIEGYATLNTSQIITESYKRLIDNGVNFQIVTDNSLATGKTTDDPDGDNRMYCPAINIYSVKQTASSQASLSLENNALVTAAIEAPDLNFSLKTAKQNVSQHITYNGTSLNGRQGMSSGAVGVIGILNVDEASGDNDWAFLYTPRQSDDDDDEWSTADPKNTKYVITYYDGF